MIKKSYTLEDKVYFALLLAVAVVMLVYDLLTPFKPDDVLHALVMGNEHERIDTVGALFRSQAYGYVNNNGRTADFIAQAFCGITGKWLFDVLNAVVAACFVHVGAHLMVPEKRSVLALALMVAFVFVLMPVPGETMLWLCGATNYLWTMTFTLALVAFLLRYDGAGAPWWKHALVLVLTLIAGSMNESVTAGTLVGMAIYYLLNPGRFKGLARTAVIGYALGVAVVFGSPAAWHRLGNDGSINADLGLWAMVRRRLINLCTKSAHFVVPVLALLVAAWMVVRRQWTRLRVQLPLFALVGVALMVLALSITNSYRSYTAFAVYGVIVVGEPLCRWLIARRWSTAVAALLLVACTWPAWKAFRALRTYKQYDDGVTAQIVAAPAECVLQASKSPVSNKWVYPVTYDNDGYMTHKHFYCCYYGKDNLQFLPADIYDRYHSGDLLAGGQAAPFTRTQGAIGDTIYTFGAHPYSIVPLGTERPRLTSSQAHVYYESMERHLGAEETARRKQWNEMPKYMPMSQYYLKQGDAYYLILPQLEPDVVAIEIPIKEGGDDSMLRFERNTNHQKP